MSRNWTKLPKKYIDDEECRKLLCHPHFMPVTQYPGKIKWIVKHLDKNEVGIFRGHRYSLRIVSRV